MRQKNIWVLILSGILVSVLLSGCVDPVKGDERERLRIQNKDLKAEIGLLKKEISNLEIEIANLRKETLALREKFLAIAPPPKLGEVVVEKVFEIPGCRVTLTSYEFSESGSIRFNFVVENLFDEPTDFMFVRRTQTPSIPRILDDQGNKYTRPEISPQGWTLVPPGMPIDGHITFTDSGLKKARTVAFYLKFNIRNGGWRASDLLYLGPIRLK